MGAAAHRDDGTRQNNHSAGVDSDVPNARQRLFNNEVFATTGAKDRHRETNECWENHGLLSHFWSHSVGPKNPPLASREVFTAYEGRGGTIRRGRDSNPG